MSAVDELGRLVIVGCGGFGREVFAMLIRSGRPLAGSVVFVDDRPSRDNLDLVSGLGAQYAGTVLQLLQQAPGSAVVAVGDPDTRQKLSRSLNDAGWVFPHIASSESSIGAMSVLDDGVVVAPGARVSTHVQLGPHVHLDQNVTVGHDTHIGAYSRANPGACVSGDVHIGERVLVGANATILQGLRVGDGAVVGAGAVVTRDVGPGATVVGVPAR